MTPKTVPKMMPKTVPKMTPKNYTGSTQNRAQNRAQSWFSIENIGFSLFLMGCLAQDNAQNRAQNPAQKVPKTVPKMTPKVIFHQQQPLQNRAQNHAVFFGQKSPFLDAKPRLLGNTSGQVLGNSGQ